MTPPLGLCRGPDERRVCVRTPRSMLRTLRSLARRVVTIDETISDFGPRLDQLRIELARE